MEREEGGLEIQMLKLILRQADKRGRQGAPSLSRNPSYSWPDMSFGMLLRVWPGEWGHFKQTGLTQPAECHGGLLTAEGPLSSS